MEEDKILDNITKSISERLKVPIIATYICVLTFYNWDIIFYLLFENVSASKKISWIKNQYGHEYYERIFLCILISILFILIFSALNTGITFCLKWFYRKDKEIMSEIESFEKVKILTEQLSESINNIKDLNSQIEDLKNINESLNSRNLNVDIVDISKKDYNNLITSLNSQVNKEKLLYSLKDLLMKLKNDINIETSEVYENAVYKEDLEMLINIMTENNLIKIVSKRNEIGSRYVNIFELSQSLKDILKMEI